jgi:hypothetical protein
MFTKDLRPSELVLISYSNFVVSISNNKSLGCRCRCKVTRSTRSSSCGPMVGVFECLILSSHQTLPPVELELLILLYQR